MPAVTPDGAVPGFKGLDEACEGVFDHKLHMNPAGELRAVAHHEVVIVLTVGNGIDAAGDEWMELDHPFGLWIGEQVGARDGGKKRQVSGTAEASSPESTETDFDGAL